MNLFTNKLTIVLLVITLLLSGLLYLQNKKFSSQQQEISNLSINLKSERHKTLFWTDTYKKSHSLTIMQQWSSQQLKQDTSAVGKRYRQIIFEQNIKIKNLQGIGTTTGSFKHDTIIKYKVLFGCHDLSDKHIQNIVCINKDSTITSNVLSSVTLDYLIKNRKETVNEPSKLFFIRWFQKKHILTELEVISNNPYFKITNQHFIQVTND